jgi:hypothetical protein
LGIAIAHDLHKTIANIDMCAESELLEVKVPLIFLGTVVSREGRYYDLKRSGGAALSAMSTQVEVLFQTCLMTNGLKISFSFALPCANPSLSKLDFRL